jgi:hypothetical protein
MPMLWAQPHAEVDSATHTFGTVIQGQKPEHTFKIKNTGNKPLIINSVDVSCGCVTADYTKSPIMPGKTGKVKLIFLTETKRGFQMRSTTVNTNADNPEIVLYLKGIIRAKAK